MQTTNQISMKETLSGQKTVQAADLTGAGASAAATAVDTSACKTSSHSTMSTTQPIGGQRQPIKSQAISKYPQKLNAALKAELSSVTARILTLNQTLHQLQNSLHQQQKLQQSSGAEGEHFFSQSTHVFHFVWAGSLVCLSVDAVLFLPSVCLRSLNKPSHITSVP
jgi:hypothetical protein